MSYEARTVSDLLLLRETRAIENEFPDLDVKEECRFAMGCDLEYLSRGSLEEFKAHLVKRNDDCR